MSVPKLPFLTQQIIRAAWAIKVRSIVTGKYNSILQTAAQEHAEYQARINTQTHNPLSRINHLLTEFPGCEVSEIVAESWDHDDDNTAGPEMFNSWRQSPGHWSVANGNVTHWGYAMARGSRGLYYGCGIAAWPRIRLYRHPARHKPPANETAIFEQYMTREDFAGFSRPDDSGNEYLGEVKKVHDADTLTIDIHIGFDIVLADQICRVANFDGWEITKTRRTVTVTDEEIKKGKIAKQALIDWLAPTHNMITVRAAMPPRDVYGRLLVYIREGVVDLGAYMTEQGHSRK